jgi:hypothetical protein
MLKPFHESIIDSLNGLSATDTNSLVEIGALIRSTKIPQNHEAISAAWMAKAKEREVNEARHQDSLEDKFSLKPKWFEEVNLSILAQKPAADAA